MTTLNQKLNVFIGRTLSEPVVIAILFADRIITENNGKKGIIGIFSQFMSHTFPVVFPPWGIYIALTNLQGKHNFLLHLVHEDSDEIVIPIKGQIDIQSQNDVVELLFNIENATFQKPGRHILTIYVDDTIVGSRILHVHEFSAAE